MIFILLCLSAYLFGSIPFGLPLTRAFGLGDIRTIGSGNIGATNVLRTGNKKLAALTLLLDALKGTVPVILVHIIPQSLTGVEQQHIVTASIFLGLLAMIGHCFPVWLNFKGGKGVATTIGVLLAAVPITGVVTCLGWLVSAKAGKISSLAAISAMVIAPVSTYACYGLYPALINVAISALVIYRHKENIKRIKAGTEPKIGEKK